MYQFTLYYGYTEGRYGVDHAFHAAGPGEKTNSDDIEKAFAEELEYDLDHPTSDCTFDYNSTEIAVPASVVEKIQADTIRAIQQKYNLVSLSDIADKALKDLNHQLREGKNLNSYGEPVAVTELPNGRYIEVTAERDGLEPKEYHYTVRVLEPAAEMDYERSHFSTRNASYQALRSAVNSVVQSFVKSSTPVIQQPEQHPLWSQLGNNDDLGFIVRAANLSGSMEATKEIEVDDWSDLENGLKEAIEKYMRLSEKSDPDFYAVVEDYLKKIFPHPTRQRGLSKQIEAANAAREGSSQKATPKSERHR